VVAAAPALVAGHDGGGTTEAGLTVPKFEEAVIEMAEKRKRTYTEAETQAQRMAVMAAVENGKTFEQAAKEAEVPVGRAKWLYRQGVALQHSTEQTSVSTDPLPEV
jgi:hypothetical protein